MAEIGGGRQAFGHMADHRSAKGDLGWVQPFDKADS